jgi:hypothetical protein
MAGPDFPREIETEAGAEPAPAAPPHLVDLPAGYDPADDFLSESEEAPAAPVVVAEERPSPGAVLAFPTAPTEPAAPASPPAVSPAPLAALPPAAVGAHGSAYPIRLLDILEKQGGLDWRECVALVHQICLQLKHHPTHAPILVEPRHIEITETGEVQLLPSPTGGDPLVMQIGRLLRTMLMGRPAPPELRLLMSQATFELPIFESIADVDRALLKIERLSDDSAASETPDASAASAPFAAQAPLAEGPTARARPIRPTAWPRRPVPRRIMSLGGLVSTASARIVTLLVGIAAIAALILATPALFVSSPARPASVAAAPAASAPAAATPPETATGTATPAVREVEATAGQRPAPRARSTGDSPSATPDASRRTQRATPIGPPPATIAAAPTATVIVPPRESERRAAALVAQGQTAEAAAVFNTMLNANPLYEPKATDLTPESLGAFRTSQRQLLPQLAQRGYDGAKAALAEGDAERAFALAKETATLLERPAAEPASHLREPVRKLIEDASVARANAEEIVYSRADSAVTPPRPLSRQFPATTPNGVPANRVGTLEMVIGRDGTVEFVKLHTPLNRYHERMIVSAAKAWLYRPATRGGKPVRYRLTVTINLPENGTY